jgi:hypothetical protein
MPLFSNESRGIPMVLMLSASRFPPLYFSISSLAVIVGAFLIVP